MAGTFCRYCFHSQSGWESLARYVLPEKEYSPSEAVVCELSEGAEGGSATVVKID